MSLDQEDQDQMLRNLGEWSAALPVCSAMVLISVDEAGEITYAKCGNTAAVYGALGIVKAEVLADLSSVDAGLDAEDSEDAEDDD